MARVFGGHVRGPLHRLRACAGDVEGDIGGECCLSHRRAAGQDDQVGRLQPTHLGVEPREAGGNAGEMSVALVGVAGHLDGGRQGIVEGEEPLAVLVRLGKREQPRLGVLDLRLGREVDRGVEGIVDHVLADHDQLATRVEIVDGTAVVARVDDGRGIDGELAKIHGHGRGGVDRLGRLEKGPQRDRCRLLAGGDQLRQRLEDLLVQGVVEVVRLEEARDAVVGLVVDEDGAEQRLLGLEVVRRGAEGEGIARVGASRGRGGLAAGECVHGGEA